MVNRTARGNVMMRGHDVSFANSFRLRAHDFGSKDSTKAVAPPRSTDREVREGLNAHLGTRTMPIEQRNPLHHKRHYRVVFREVAQPIWSLTNLSDVFRILEDLATVLKYIHEAGWVHRDISAGNIYFFKGNEHAGRGLIGDLEYAKNVAMDRSHELRMGTPDFMAVEVSVNGYQFLPSSEPQMEIRKHAKMKAYGQSRDRPKVHFPFAQNEAHDIESLWWVANYILFFNRDSSVKDTPVQEAARLQWMQRIFPSSEFVNDRLNFLRDGGTYENNTSWFSDSFLELRNMLNFIRSALTSCYTELESTLPVIGKGTFDELHENAIEIFEICRDLASNVEISSFKAKGRQNQKDISQSISQSVTPQTGQITLMDMPRKPKEQLGLRHA